MLDCHCEPPAVIASEAKQSDVRWDEIAASLGLLAMTGEERGTPRNDRGGERELLAMTGGERELLTMTGGKGNSSQ